MVKQINKIWQKKWLLAVIISGSFLGYYFLAADTISEAEGTFAVVETVTKGVVSSGIETSGTIVAARKLDLNVYKQSGRIEAVNVRNAGRVNEGDIILSFDKSKALVSTQSARVAVAESALAVAIEEAKFSDPNSSLRTLQNTVISLNQDLIQAEKDKEQAQRDFFNANKAAVPGSDLTEGKNRPIISGLFAGSAPGTYTIVVYASAAPSGLSYAVTGLESGREAVIDSIATPIGSSGLKITFPPDVAARDSWIVHVPNREASEYIENKAKYEKSLSDLAEVIRTKKVEIANTEQQIKNETQTDNMSHRELALTRALARLAASRQQLTENVDEVQEQDIVAPFSGTVEGMRNVVVGASPTGATNDSVSLGTLVSDDFLVTFDLSAVDVAKVSVGQKVLVEVTSFPGLAPLEASILEISSLPKSAGVAQYTVQALIALPAESEIQLREGLLAQVMVVDQEVTDVLKIPRSALTYQNGQARVQVLNELTPEQAQELDRLGLVKSVEGVFPSRFVDVVIGISGAYDVEVKEGLTEGMQILVTQTVPNTTVVGEDIFGPPPRDESAADTAPDAAP